MKIAVYAICKNEEKFLKDFLHSSKDADFIMICDTGSTDKTVSYLKTWKLNWKHKFDYAQINVMPWRFDEARNTSLNLLPADIDVAICLDLDERLQPGWRKVIEDAFTKNPDVDRLRYNYVWSWNADGTPGLTYHADKIHRRNCFRWVNPVHEVLKKDMRLPPENQIFVGDTLIHHYPDTSKSRGQYFPLLELSVKENPLDDRGLHYYGRELFFYDKYQDAIDMLKRHLAIGTWKSERGASMRYIAKSYWALGFKDVALEWHMAAAEEAPDEREGWVELAQAYRAFGKWQECKETCEKALAITVRPNLYLNDPIAWSDWPDKMLEEANVQLQNQTI